MPHSLAGGEADSAAATGQLGGRRLPMSLPAMPASMRHSCVLAVKQTVLPSEGSSRRQHCAGCACLQGQCRHALLLKVGHVQFHAMLPCGAGAMCTCPELSLGHAQLYAIFSCSEGAAIRQGTFLSPSEILAGARLMHRYTVRSSSGPERSASCVPGAEQQQESS